MCINIFRLNTREQLITSRRTTQDSVSYKITKLQTTFSELIKGDTIDKASVYRKLILHCDQLINIWQGQEAYTMAAQNILKKNGFSLKWLCQTRQGFQEALSKAEFQQENEANEAS
jgi:hypothetical protein